MKKILLSLLSITFSVVAYSQIPLVEYKPVRVEKGTNGIWVPSYANPQSTPNNVNEQSREQVIIGYAFNPNTNNFKRAKIKVKTVYGSLYVTAIFNGRTEQWHDLNSQAKKVGQIVGIDSEMIRDNFEWKVDNTRIGTVYFNY